jgi:hypothetical protein
VALGAHRRHLGYGISIKLNAKIKMAAIRNTSHAPFSQISIGFSPSFLHLATVSEPRPSVAILFFGSYR